MQGLRLLLFVVCCTLIVGGPLVLLSAVYFRNRNIQKQMTLDLDNLPPDERN